MQCYVKPHVYNSCIKEFFEEFLLLADTLTLGNFTCQEGTEEAVIHRH